MNYCAIDGINYDVDVSFDDYENWWEHLDGPNAGRVLYRGQMHRDVIGTFEGWTITFRRRGGNYEAFDRLWDYLKRPHDYVTLTAVDGQTEVTQRVYASSARRKLNNVSGGVNYWNEMTVNFIPIEATIIS